MKYSIGISKFLVFPILLFSFISLHCSLRKSFLSFLALLLNSAVSWVFLFLSSFPLHFFSQLFVKPPQTTTLPSISFSLAWFWSQNMVKHLKQNLLNNEHGCSRQINSLLHILTFTTYDYMKTLYGIGTCRCD